MRKTNEPNSAQFAIDLNPGKRGMRLGNRITFGEHKSIKSAKLASRNAYRAAIGLPLIKF